MPEQDFNIERKDGGVVSVTPVQNSENPYDNKVLTPEATGVNREPYRVTVGGNSGEARTENFNAYREGVDVQGSLQHSWGSPATDIQDAIANPEKYTVEVGGSRTSLAAAIRSGMVKVKNGQLSETEWKSEMAQDQEPERTIQQDSFMSAQASKFVEVCREISSGNFDASLSALLAHVGTPSSDHKVEAALNRFAQDIGAKSFDEARNTFNGLVGDVMQHTETQLETQYGEQTAKDSIQYLMNEVEPNVRASIFLGLMYGDQRMLTEIVERHQLKNKF